MRTWRRRTAWGLLLVVVAAFFAVSGTFVAPGVAAICAACTLAALCWVAVAAALCLISMTRYAAANFGRGYAVRHLLLAILLAPVLLLGVFAVTRLVEADIERWHLNRDRPGPLQ